MDRENRSKLLEKAIPSDYMRNFYHSINREFTDLELAAMLWNSRMKRAEILRAIKDLSELTDDDALRGQIESRLKYEEGKILFFSDNEAGTHVYTVEYEDEEWPCGFFKNLDRAVEFGCKDGKRSFLVQKQLIVEDEPPMQKVGEWNPYLFPEKKNEPEEYYVCPDAEASYSAGGELLGCWGVYLPDEIRDLVDNWSMERFENYPVILETPFEKGDIVLDGDEIGVIDITREEMRAFAESIKKAKYVEYLDTATTIVQYIGEDGRIHHNHPSLLFLKKVEKKELPPDIQEYVSMVSYMIQGEYSLDFFLLEYEKRIEKYRSIASS